MPMSPVRTAGIKTYGTDTVKMMTSDSYIFTISVIGSAGNRLHGPAFSAIIKEEHKMPDYLCVMIVGSLVIGFILGRWRVPPDYCGDVIISADSETCTFALDIPADDIPKYHALVFRVVEEKDSR